ncbi:MAG: DUF1338 domain-containing protein [Myxococcales bacterium]|nr:DUF1338 domain-containing protein [Myxococcales bacterium]MCB9525195.1 DUF1338 domain-containing protein [Myxococcales bacterium]
MHIEPLFEQLWRDYAAVTPSAARIQALLAARGEPVTNDHIALRTFDVAGIDLDTLARPFLDLGYVATGEYAFPVKRLQARSYSHPAGHPRVFISQLVTAEFSDRVQRAARGFAAQVGPNPLTGQRWDPPAHAVYEALRQESEYAAWLAAFGIRANHFTVAVHALKTFDGLEALNDWLLHEGFGLNDRGGLIKGGPGVCLAQSSTWADRVQWAFADKIAEVPSCYYEFAQRFPGPDGALYDGFVTDSADRIFESTDHRAPS